MDPDVEFGQISSGCEVLISPKEWDRSVAQLPPPPLALPSPIATVAKEAMVMDMDKRQSLFGSFVNYFKATEKIPQKVNNSSNLYVESFDMRKRNTCFSIDWINSKNLIKLKWHCFKSPQNQLNFTNFVAHFREMKIMYRVSQQVGNEFHKIFAIEASTVLQKNVFLRLKIAF